MTRPWLRSLPLLALVGCAGSVSLEEVEPFGGAASALWIHWEDSDFDSIVLTNVVGACGKLQTYAEAQKEFYDAIEDVDLDDYCEEAEEPTLDLARAADALYHKGTKTLTFTVFADGSTEPDEDTYEVGDLGAALGGSMAYYENSPTAAYLTDWDAEADWEDNCGVDEDDTEADVESWSVADGELEIQKVDDEAGLAGFFEGELDDEDGDGAGDIAARFSATYCEVDL